MPLFDPERSERDHAFVPIDYPRTGARSGGKKRPQAGTGRFFGFEKYRTHLFTGVSTAVHWMAEGEMKASAEGLFHLGATALLAAKRRIEAAVRPSIYRREAPRASSMSKLLRQQIGGGML